MLYNVNILIQGICSVYKRSQFESLHFSFFILICNLIFLVHMVLIILLNIFILGMGFYMKVFPKDLVILSMVFNDLLLAIFWFCMIILIHSNKQYSFKTYTLCYFIALISLVSVLLDLCLKIIDSFSVYSVTKTSIIKTKRSFFTVSWLILFMMLLSGLISSVVVKFSLKEQLDFNTKFLKL